MAFLMKIVVGKSFFFQFFFYIYIYFFSLFAEWERDNLTGANWRFKLWAWLYINEERRQISKCRHFGNPNLLCHRIFLCREYLCNVAGCCGNQPRMHLHWVALCVVIILFCTFCFVFLRNLILKRKMFLLHVVRLLKEWGADAQNAH